MGLCPPPQPPFVLVADIIPKNGPAGGQNENSGAL